MQPLVSVVVPCYNAKHHIKKCIKSIQNQTYKNIEIVCVNDGSTDGTDVILDHLSTNDARVKVIHNANQGVSATRNCGLENSKGEYIQFVDSDDEILSNVIEKTVNAIIQDDSDMVFFGYRRSDNVDIHVPYTGCKSTTDVIKDFYEIYSGGVFNQPWNKLYKKSLITHLFDDEMSIAEDAVFNMHYISNTKKISFLDELGYYYMVGNPNSLSVKYNEKGLESEEKKIIAINNLLEEYEAIENLPRLNKLHEQDFLRCVHDFVYASGKGKSIIKKEIIAWINSDIWKSVLLKNRDINQFIDKKVEKQVDRYINKVLFMKKTGQFLRGKRDGR